MLIKKNFQILIKNYPDTEYAMDAEFKIDLINDILAAHDVGIPVVAVLHGFSTAGGAYQIGMSDYVIAVKGNGMAALAGAALLKAATGESASNQDIGGAEMHSVITGSVEYLAKDDVESISISRKLINQLN